MRHVDVKEKIPELMPQPPDWPAFVRLGNLTKLRARPDGSFYRANFESGMLLYALVRRFQPRSILEIGTGRGFGALSLAMGMRDEGIAGRVLTVDVLDADQPQEWALDEGTGPRVARLSRAEVWGRHFDRELLSRIECAQGTSTEALDRLLRSRTFRADLVYIDADHSWPGARHDYLASLLLANRPFRILLDDYQPRSDLYGVRRLVDEEVERDFETEAIYTDRRWHGEENAAVPLSNASYAQVLVDSDRARKGLDQILDRGRLIARLGRHRRFGHVVDLWRQLARRLRPSAT
jgi:hypothetical protein